MEGSKIVLFLARLSKLEHKQFRTYLASPFFNSNMQLIALYHELEEQLVFLGNSNPGKEAIWQKAFPDEPWNDEQFRTLCSQLLKKGEGFLVQLGLEKRAFNRQHILLEELNSRQLDKHLNYRLNNSRKTLEKSDLRDSQFYHNNFELEAMQHYFNERQNFRSVKLSPEAALKSLDCYYLSTKLKYSCELLNLRNILQFDFEISLLDELMVFLENEDYADIPAIAIYYQILLMLRKEEKEPHFQKLRALAAEKAHHFKRQERREIYTYMINYCIQQANMGKVSYLKELLTTYKEALENNVLFDQNNQMMPSTFKNVVAVGLRVGEFEWTRKFIGSYKKKLPPAYQNNAYTYNLAKYYYATGDHDKVMRMLQQVEYDDVFYNLDSKSMLLKIYYEQGETDSLFSLFDSFSVYLRRNKLISKKHKNNYFNLIKFTKRLLNIPRGDMDKLEQLRERISGTTGPSDVNWLLKQIDVKEGRRHTA